MNKIGCRIKSINSYFPNKIVTNVELSKKISTSDIWIQDKLGIKQRHIVDEEHASDLGYKASLKALKDINMTIDDIDLIITATSSPDRISPSTACLIQDKLKPTRNIPSFDLNAVCSGFMYSMEVATSLLNKYHNILIVCTETYSKWTDWDDRNCVFFGDGAGAVILSNSTRGWYYGNIFADGSGKENFTIHHGKTFKMNGKEVYRVGTQVLPESINKILNDLNMNIDEIDYFVPHQPSYKILEKTSEIIGLPKEKIIMNMDIRANTAGASIPTALDKLCKENIIKNGDKILFASVGSGWTWGAGVLSWSSYE